MTKTSRYILITLGVIIGSIIMLLALAGPAAGYVLGFIVLIVGCTMSALLPTVCIPWFIRIIVRKYRSGSWSRYPLLLGTYVWALVASAYALYFVFPSMERLEGNRFVSSFSIGCATSGATLAFSPKLVLKLIPQLQTLEERRLQERKVEMQRRRQELFHEQAFQMDERDMTTEEKVEFGCMHQHAYGLARDYEKAKRLYEEVIAVGDNPQAAAEARNHLAFMYLYGKGVEVNYAEVKRLCEEVVQQNAIAGQTEIAIKYLERINEKA